MTEGVCHPAATLARKFESLAGLLAFIHKQTGAEGLRAVLKHSSFPADYLILAITELQAMDLPAVAEIVWEVAKHGTFCHRAGIQFPYSWWRKPPCDGYCGRLQKFRENHRLGNLTAVGERFLEEVVAREFTEPEKAMKGEYQLYWETLQTRELLRRIGGDDQWPENQRFWEWRNQPRRAATTENST
jgi:hypothetical protein